MSRVGYANHVNPSSTPQKRPVLGRQDQVLNDAGGYVFQVSDAHLARRFLILGTQGGTYYASERRLTIEAADALRREIARDGMGVVDQIIQISIQGEAPKQEPLLFALALCASAPDERARDYALVAMREVIRTGSQMFTFTEYLQTMRGYGPRVLRAYQAWFESKSPATLAYQFIKYRERDGWTWRDIFRLTHPKFDGERLELVRWVTHDDAPPPLWLGSIKGYTEIKPVRDGKRAAELITQYKLPREAVPSEVLGDPAVWAALLPDMPIGALLRNLSSLGRAGLLVPGKFETIRFVTERLRDRERIAKGRIHPMTLLFTMKSYGLGSGRGGQDWPVVPEVLDALTDAFYAAFETLPSTGKRLMIAIDVSGSMQGTQVTGSTVLAPEAAAALALAYAHSEPNTVFVAFGNTIGGLPISNRQRLNDILMMPELHQGGGTDCALPMQHALMQRMPIDAFVLLTDSQSWAGEQHAFQALNEYRKKMGIPAKFIAVQMVYNQYTVSDITDPLSLDCIGLDGATSSVINQFLTM